jgi:hypothetical protein
MKPTFDGQDYSETYGGSYAISRKKERTFPVSEGNFEETAVTLCRFCGFGDDVELNAWGDGVYLERAYRGYGN